MGWEVETRVVLSDNTMIAVERSMDDLAVALGEALREQAFFLIRASSGREIAINPQHVVSIEGVVKDA